MKPTSKLKINNVYTVFNVLSLHLFFLLSLSEFKEKINPLQIAIVNKHFSNIKHAHYLSKIQKAKNCSNKKSNLKLIVKLVYKFKLETKIDEAILQFLIKVKLAYCSKKVQVVFS